MPMVDSLNLVNVISSDADKLSAMPEHVLAGYFFIGKQKYLAGGTIPILNTLSDTTLLGSERHLVQKGYNPQDYYVNATSVESQTQATAINEDILNGKTAWVNGVKVTGIMPNNGAVAPNALKAGDEYMIPVGYHNGNGKVVTVSLKEQTTGDATAENVLQDKVVWVNGVKVVGTMSLIAPVQTTLSAGETHTIEKGYHDGTGTVVARDLASQTVGTATQDDILDGMVAWVNGVQVTGKVGKIASQEIELPINGTYNIPAGYHSGRGSVTQKIETQETITITPAFDDQTISVKGKYMTGDLYVTGINALNYQHSNSTTEFLFNETITPDYSTGTNFEKELIKLDTDNWHDQATNNVYFVQVQDLSDSSNPVDIIKGCIYMNNLSDDINAYNMVLGKIDGVSYSVDVTLYPLTSEHTFTLNVDWANGSTPTNTSLGIKIKECLGLRKYGDDHDQ